MSNASHNQVAKAEVATSAPHSTQKDDKKSISRAAFRVGVGGILSLGAGFLNQMVIAALFGAGEGMDSYLTALTIPSYIQGVLFAGLSFVFIPAFVKDVEEGREDEAWRLVGTFFWLIGGVFLIMSLLMWSFAPQILRITAPGLSPDKAALSAQMLSVLAFVILFSGYGSFTSGIQNARGKFFWPAAGGAVNSIVNLLALLVLYRYLGPLALAWSFLLAIAMQACVTTIPIVRHGWSGRLPFNDERVIETLKLVLPFVLLGLITRIGPVFERFFASGLPDGDLSYIGYANKTVRIFQSMLAVTVVTATFPVMSKNFARDGVKGLLSTFKYSARLTLATAIPVVMIGSIIAPPLIEVLFQRGAFTPNDSVAVARIIPIVLLEAILFAMIGNLLTRAFYVTKDTRTVPIVTSSAMIPYIFVAYWGTRQWGYVGLAGASAFYALLGVIALLALLLRRYSRQQLSLVKGARYFLRYAALGAIAALIAYWSLVLLGNLSPLIQLLAAGVAGAAGYVLFLFMADREIAVDMLAIIGITQLGNWLQRQYRRNRQRVGISGAAK